MIRFYLVCLPYWIFVNYIFARLNSTQLPANNLRRISTMYCEVICRVASMAKQLRLKNCLWWPCLSMDRDEMSSLYRCFLPSFSSLDQAVSEEKNFKNQPIRNKSHLWWPCLLMYRNKMSNLKRGSSIDASYQDSVHFAKRFQRRRF